ncbi:MAG: 50S ribosomal protein L25 [bacterium]
MLSLNAKTRDLNIDLKDLRKSGEIPAVFYGMGNVSTPISISIVEFKKAWEKAGESSTIKITGLKIAVDVLIHDVQVDAVTSEPIHVDFLVIDMAKKVKVEVPLEFSGVSAAVKNGLGTLVKVLHEVEIEALPKDIPHNFIIDISKLATLDSQILVSDIVLPSDVVMVSKGTEVVASVAVQKEEVEVAEPIDLTKIEVEKKGKKEEEETPTDSK